MKRFLIAMLIVVSLTLPSLLYFVPHTLAATLYPPKSTLSSKTIQSLAMPAEMQTVTDPTFGNQVERVSDQTAFGSTSQYLRHEYAKIQVWNADDSLAFITGWADFNQGFVIDGKTGHYLRTVNNVPDGNHSARWSNVNPNNMYGIPPGATCNNNNQLDVWHPKTDTASSPALTVLHTFSQFDTCAHMTIGIEEGNFSNDDSKGAVIGWSSTQTSWGIVTFSMTNTMANTPTVTEIATTWLGPAGGTTNNEDNANWNNITEMPKGDGVLVQWDAGGPGINQGIEWFPNTLTNPVHVTNTSDHYDTGVTAGSPSKEAVVAGCGQPGGVDTNTCTGVTQPTNGARVVSYVMGATGPTGPNTVLQAYSSSLSYGTHISCRNFNRPGWCYLSDMMNDPTEPVGYEQIYALNLDGSGTVEVFGVDHGSQNTCSSCNADAAMAVPTQDGSRVMFASDWGAGSTAPVYDYIAQWPQNPHYQPITNVFVIMMENHDWSAIKGASDAPYINGLLTRSDASYASNYHNVLSTEAGGNLHPSEPNYIWTEAATNNFSDHTFTTDDDATNGNYTTSTSHLVHNLSSWAGYMESSPGGCPVTSSGDYAAKHNPFVFFTDVAGNPPSSTNANCASHIKDTSQLATDATNGAFPAYSYIVPNLCDDMHDSCAPTSDPVKQGDDWLSTNLPTILNSAQYKAGGAVFITWDEDSSDSNNALGMIALSPFAKGYGYTNSINYSHTSLVKTVQNIFGLPAVGNSVNTSPPDLSDLFSIGLKNGSFENTGTSWLSPWFINQSISGSSTTQDGSTFVDGTHSANNYMPTAGANDSAYRLIQTGQYIRQGQTYMIIFWLKADVARTVRARMGQSVAPGSPYGADTVNVTTSWQKFTWTFTSSVTDSNAQFSLNMGNAAGHVWVDAVSIG